MSQWGAQGAASQGVDAETIVSTYYPGTQRGVLASAPIRVLLSADDGTDTQVVAAAGLQVRDLSTGALRTLPAGPSRWRAVPTATGLQLQSLTGQTWKSDGAATAGPLRFGGSTFVRVVFPGGASRDYRGGVQAVRTSATRLQTVDVLSLEDYLLGVVPRESSSSWRPAALQAQAIAARSYSANKRDRVAGTGSYDICDTTACQVFGGSRLYTSAGQATDLEPATTTAAVQATAGVVRTYGGKAILAEFSSSNGGWSTAGNLAYQVARRDDWDGAVPNPVHSWTATLRATDLERAFPAVGTLQRIRVTGRDGNGEWGGRVRAVVLEGVDRSGKPTSVSSTGAGVYNAHSWPGSGDGLRSTWWHLIAAQAAEPAQPTVLTAEQAGLPTGRGVFTDGRSVVLERSGVTTVAFSLRNTGTKTWPVGPVLLGTASPRNRASASSGSGWATANRTGVLDAPVAPGQTGTISLTLHGNARPVGTTAEAFEPLWSGLGWLDGALRTLNVTRVDPAVPSIAGLHSGPAARLDLDGTSTLVYRLRNLGGRAWTVGTEALTSTTGAFAAADGWTTTPPPLAANAVRPGARTVEPGEIGEWRVPVSSARRAGGDYLLSLQPVAAGARYGPVLRTTLVVAVQAAPRTVVAARPVFKGSGPRARTW